MTRIITIVDAFDAITSHRAYDYARPVQSAFEILRSASGRQFDEELVREFIRWLGAFPVGTLVELHTGEVAVVVEQLQLRAGRGAARCGKAALHAALSGPGADHRGRGGHALSHLRWAARWLLRSELQSILHPQAWPTSNWTPEPWHPTACAAVSRRKA